MAVPLTPVGNTITFTANTSAPTAVQAPALGSAQCSKYTITNIGTVPVFVGWGVTAAIAAANAVVPTGTSTLVQPILAGAQITISAMPNAYFSGVASASSIVYVTPVEGG